MRGYSHALIGAATGILVSNILKTNYIETTAICTTASVLVDIDENNSLINQILFPINKNKRPILKATLGAAMCLFLTPYGSIITKYMGKMIPSLFMQQVIGYLGLILILSVVSGKVEYRFSLFKGFEKREYHRTYFHNPIIGIIILAAPLFYLNISSHRIIAYIAGLFTHYLADSFTAYGLPRLSGVKPIRMPIYYHSDNTIIEMIIVAGYLVLMFTLNNQLVH
ncbi:MAG: metal-dependent hydrolase [Clostridia bacterium]